jgi:hypothetical protein
MADLLGSIPFVGQGVGLGLEAFGAFEQYSAAKKQSDISKQEVGVEQQQDAVRKQAMELQYNRQSMQNLRQTQLARSMAISNATQGGSQQGSGLQGGLAGISGQSGVNQLGLNQNLAFGEQMFGLNSSLNALKIQMAGTQAQSALGQGLSGIGGGVMSAGSSWGKGGKTIQDILDS